MKTLTDLEQGLGEPIAASDIVRFAQIKMQREALERQLARRREAFWEGARMWTFWACVLATVASLIIAVVIATMRLPGADVAFLSITGCALGACSIALYESLRAPAPIKADQTERCSSLGGARGEYSPELQALARKAADAAQELADAMDRLYPDTTMARDAAIADYRLASVAETICEE